MSENNITIKIKSARYIVYLVFLFYSVMMFTTATLLNWPDWINTYCIISAILITIIIFIKHISTPVHMYLITTVAMLNIAIYSWAEGSFYQSGIIICGLALILSLFMDIHVLIYQTFLTIFLLFTHLVFFNTIPLVTLDDICNYLMRIPAMFLIQILLIAIIVKIEKAQSELTSNMDRIMNAEQSKSEFLANMSHEIRTPMNAIVGMCELILREPDISDNVREDCFNIQTSGRSLLAIVNDILDFSKIESGKMEIIEQEYNIASTLNDVINMAMTRKGDKKIELIVEVDPDIPCGLIGDELRIRQIIVNLMTNAIKFTPEGAVTLRISQTKQNYGINLNVTVIDSGIGITPEDLERLFTSFQQVDTKKNRSIEGTGLGLAISKQLLTSMGGFISVNSEYGKGSEFHFVVPQKVSNATAFISVKNVEQVHVVGFIDMHKFNNSVTAQGYRELIANLIEGLRIKCNWYSQMDSLKEALAKGEATHCFIGREEYLAEKEYFTKIANQCEVVIVQDRTNAVIPPANMKCIYKPFYALSIVSVLNNENIVFNMNERRGSSIRFVAPKARVLIVDDNIINLKVAVGLMRPYRMQIATAESAKAAIAMLRSKDFDLVFMDHMMPEIDGVEAAGMIREMEDEYYKKLPIIALTANAVNGVHEMFLACGMNDFIAKPIELSTLDRVLKKWLPPECIQNPSEEDFRAAQTVKPVANEEKNPFFNPENGLVYTGGDKDTYLDILNVFVHKSSDKSEYISQLFDKKDWKNYVIEVHALKSSSRSIGSSSLSELAKTLELAGKAGDYDVILRNHKRLIEQYLLVSAAADDYLIEHQTKVEESQQLSSEFLPEIPKEQMTELLTAINQAVDNFDGDEIIRLSEELSAFIYKGYVFKKSFDEIIQLANDFEYDAVKEHLQKITEIVNER